MILLGSMLVVAAMASPQFWNNGGHSTSNKFGGGGFGGGGFGGGGGYFGNHGGGGGGYGGGGRHHFGKRSADVEVSGIVYGSQGDVSRISVTGENSASLDFGNQYAGGEAHAWSSISRNLGGIEKGFSGFGPSENIGLEVLSQPNMAYGGWNIGAYNDTLFHRLFKREAKRCKLCDGEHNDGNEFFHIGTQHSNTGSESVSLVKREANIPVFGGGSQLGGVFNNLFNGGSGSGSVSGSWSSSGSSSSWSGSSSGSLGGSKDDTGSISGSFSGSQSGNNDGGNSGSFSGSISGSSIGGPGGSGSDSESISGSWSGSVSGSHGEGGGEWAVTDEPYVTPAL